MSCAQVNYQQLPINQPKCPYHNNMHDGLMQMTARDEEVHHRMRCHVQEVLLKDRIN